MNKPEIKHEMILTSVEQLKLAAINAEIDRLMARKADIYMRARSRCMVSFKDLYMADLPEETINKLNATTGYPIFFDELQAAIKEAKSHENT